MNVSRMDPEGFKTCPFCKEEIRATAIKCRFCGEWLDSKPEQKSAVAPPVRVESPVETSTESVPDAFGTKESTIEHDIVSHQSESSPPPIPKAETPNKRNWELTTRLNWASAALLIFCVVTLALVLGRANLNGNAAEKLGEALGRILICAGFFSWLSRKRAKGSALFVFSLVCALGVACFAYYFHVGRQAAKERNKQWAENTLDFYTNALDFMQQGATGSIPSVKLTGDPVNDAASQMMRASVASIVNTTGRMKDEIDSLGKRDVFGDSVLESRQILQQEISKRSDALAILEKYRSAFTSIKEECKLNISARGLTETDKQAMIRGMEKSFQKFSPQWDSLINSRANVEAADRDFLLFLSGAFDNYRLKAGKIVFGGNTNLAKYKALSKAVTDANAELESMVRQFVSGADAERARIRSLGGLDPAKR